MRSRMSEGLAHIGTPLKEALKRTPKPVGYYDAENEDLRREIPAGEDGEWWEPVYTESPQRTWVGLTDEEIEDVFCGVADGDYLKTGRLLEAKLKEKNT